jgi:hypothetical protein
VVTGSTHIQMTGSTKRETNEIDVNTGMCYQGCALLSSDSPYCVSCTYYIPYIIIYILCFISIVQLQT